MLGKRKKHWEFFRDWVEIYGTDRAAGKEVQDFSSAAKSILLCKKYKDIVNDKISVNQDGVVETSSNVGDGSDTSCVSKRRRRNVGDFDAEFIEQMKSIVGPPPVSIVGDDGKDLRTRRIDGLDVELKKIAQLTSTYRILVGDLIATSTGKLEHFYSLSDEDREVYVKVVLTKMDRPIW